MDKPRADKVAVVDEVRDRLAAADGAVLTEYRGLTVAELAALRRQLTAAGGDYKVYKNTLVRLAVAGGPQAELGELLTGPTAIAFVHGDVSTVAKALRTFSRENPSLVVKGGMVDGGMLTPRDIDALAMLPSRDVLLAQFAGGLSAPLQQLAGLMQALPRNLAYGLAALADQRREAGEADGTEAAAAPSEEAPTEQKSTDRAAAGGPGAGEASVTESPEADGEAEGAEPVEAGRAPAGTAEDGGTE